MIVWGRINIHRSFVVAGFITSLNDRIVIEFLLAYAPKLNPIENVGCKRKRYLLPNFS
ncbi:hypothetical protein DQM68_08915 [Leptospira mayottensis]|uniref:Transposase n=1 Tax=Leptospira mayottensis TaxID=1137606 RepID=A0ABN5NW45_9LEPT|nr:transposase [Leptospira mayottensis]AXR60783.1 hypothetical protein DQM68_08915 [Leptospira mayottensis]AXR64655.1 hypothetical protein DQM28_10935 [Leptospira mayottensis]AZQ02784.1 hypothetical protein LEP1GSC190_12775 [Leptospira mayottensis 200901116]TGN11541.1 hypothetical protein EHR03_06610 [Leptospira mayottensis]